MLESADRVNSTNRKFTFLVYFGHISFGLCPVPVGYNIDCGKCLTFAFGAIEKVK